MDHIFFLLDVSETVSYYGDGIPNRVFMKYDEFLGFLRRTFPKIVNYEGLKKELDSFQIVMLSQSGLWEIVEPDYKENPNQGRFVELVALNQDKNQEEPINNTLRKSSYMLHEQVLKKKSKMYKSNFTSKLFGSRR